MSLAWRRIIAFGIDYGLAITTIRVLSGIIQWFIAWLIIEHDASVERLAEILNYIVPLFLIFLVWASWELIVSAEAGPKGATIGKHFMKIRVIGTLNGIRNRNAIKIMPLLLWFLPPISLFGYSMAPLVENTLQTVGVLLGLLIIFQFFIEDGETFYDRISGTEVVHDAQINIA